MSMTRRGSGDEAGLIAAVLQAFEEAGADFEPVLDLVCRLGAQLTGDAWVVRIVDEDHRLRTVGSAALDAETAADIRSTMAPLAPRFSTRTTTPVWGEPGTAVLLTPAVLAANKHAAEPELLELADRQGLVGGVVAPMRARGRVVGVLWWACTAHDGAHGEDDVRFATSVADRCALAIDNARLLRSIDAERNRHAAVLAHVSDAVCVVDAAGTILHVTPGGVTRVLGWEPDDLVGTQLFDLVHRGDQEHALAGFLRALGPDDWKPLVVRARHKDGSWRHLLVSAQNLLDDPALGGVVVTGRDVTEQVFADRLLSDENDILERVAFGAPLNDTLDAVCRMIDGHVRRGSTAIYLVDDQHGVLVPTAGPSLAVLPPLDDERSRGGVGFASGLPRDRVSVSLVREAPEWEPWRAEALAAGTLSAWTRPIADANGRVYGCFFIFRRDEREPEESERQAIELGSRLAAVAVRRARDADRLAHAATHDSVTDLPNRRLFLDRLGQAVARQQRGARPPSVLFVDLDGFKQVNDRSGHHAGDDVLRELAGRLLAVVRPTDVVARFGGDEFAVMCDETGEREARAVAERLLGAVCEPVPVGGRRHHLSASIGIATGNPTMSDEALLRRADVAMYRAKAKGAGGIVAYRTSMQQGAHATLERDLRRAIDDRDIVVHYQPIASLVSGQWVGVEALARWHHPVHGWVPPDRFVPLAEEIGLAIPLHDAVLDQVCADAVEWRRDPAMSSLIVGFNASGRQLADPRFVASVERHMLASPILAGHLLVELTETTMMEEYDVARAAVDALQALGVHLAIDDFGTGHSTLARLRQFPALCLKLDQSFVHELGIDQRSRDIVAAITQLAHALGMEVCAEGVETGAQLTSLADLGVDVVQGYYFARPMPAADLRALVATPVAALAG
jgi:diguanylate cyclase (GGDEF)-like protein/PAS domain S-box-containing protein